MREVSVKVKILGDASDVRLPAYQTEGAAGMDLHACLGEPLSLKAGEWAVIPTGLALSIPAGYEAQVRPRSGLASRHGITVLNSPGTIDSDYRGEVCIILINHGGKDYSIEPGERIAQMIFAPVTRAALELSRELDTTERACGGFGHTGS
jgi:dUTP pyrophosphatase